jgi:hypothetical protein
MRSGAVAVSSARDSSRISRRLVVVRFWLPMISAALSVSRIFSCMYSPVLVSGNRCTEQPAADTSATALAHAGLSVRTIRHCTPRRAALSSALSTARSLSSSLVTSTLWVAWSMCCRKFCAGCRRPNEVRCKGGLRCAPGRCAGVVGVERRGDRGHVDGVGVQYPGVAAGRVVHTFRAVPPRRVAGSGRDGRGLAC